MSVLMEFAMFPTDKGESVSMFVSRIIRMIDDSGYPYTLTSMGTIVETETLKESLDLVEKSHRELEPDCSRIYTTIKLDIRKGKGNRMTEKVRSIEQKTGRVNT